MIEKFPNFKTPSLFCLTLPFPGRIFFATDLHKTDTDKNSFFIVCEKSVKVCG